MIAEVEITSEPAVEPLTVAEFHTWIGLSTSFTDDDAAIIPNVIKSARQTVESYLNRALITQTITVWYSSFREKIYLPLSPVISVTTVTTKRLDQSVTLVENSDYFVQGNKDKWIFITNPLDVTPGTSPRDNLNGFELEVVYIGGYGAASTDIPQGIIDSVAMIASANYANRMGDNKGDILTTEVKQKLNSFKIYSI